jgi:chromosome segregation ATPase
MAQQNAHSVPALVAETFEDELAAITEKGKDLKGDQRIFYQSIVERVANNVEVLAGLRTEHTQLREKLRQLVAEKADLTDRTTLEGDIRHTSHDVNLLKKQLDKVVHDKKEAIRQQEELEAILANHRHAEAQVHPEDTQIAEMKNRLDRANIKTGETTHLIKIYERIIYLFDRQKMKWAPAVRRSQDEIRAKDRDINDLTFISRDSRFARDLAKTEYFRTRQQISKDKQGRMAIMQRKTAAQIALQVQQQELVMDDKSAKQQQSMNSQPSVYRNRQYKALREKREERHRVVSEVYEDIRDHFGTNDPEKIAGFFREREQNNQTLEKQITELKTACGELQRQIEQLEATIEEAEYASSKGVGGSRLLSEGNAKLSEKQEELARWRREVAATEVHQKRVAAGVAHLVDAMALVRDENEEVDIAPDRQIEWLKAKLVTLKAHIDDSEDFDFLEIANKPVLAQMIAAAERGMGFDDQEGGKKAKKADHKKAPKGGDVQTRVLDRNAVKVQALKTVQASQPAQKKGPK